MSKFTILPCHLDEANLFIRRHHRHHGPVIGHKFSLSVSIPTSDDCGLIVGVAVVGRPVSRMLDDGLTLEVYRVATDGTKDACSALYGACRRACFALGYRKLITYILQSEPGTSLKAAGWKCIGEAGGGSWSRPSRTRIDTHPLQTKLRYEVEA